MNFTEDYLAALKEGLEEVLKPSTGTKKSAKRRLKAIAGLMNWLGYQPDGVRLPLMSLSRQQR